jgi:mono/diheme cytochrome c family protein
MREVINNSTPYLTDADLAAIAVFLKSLPARGAEPAPAAAPPPAGAAVYAANCQFCHRADGGAAPPYLPPLAGNPTVQDADPVSLVNLVLNGADPLVVRGVPEPYRMPQFREQLSNQQIADVIGYIRGAWGNHAGPISPEGVGALRNRTDPSSDRVIVLKMR